MDEGGQRGLLRFAIVCLIALAGLAACGGSQAVRQSRSSATSASATASPAPPSGDTTGSVRLSHLPDSSEDQADITIAHACGPGAPSCIWYAAASQYPVGTPCPAVIDASRVIWTGSVQQAPGTISEKVAFRPPAGARGVKVCAYVHDQLTGDQLVPARSELR